MTTPRSVLIGWELGAGRGHLMRLVPVINALREDGWEVIAAMRDLPAAREVFAEVGKRNGPGSFMLGQAPIFLHRSTVSKPVYSLPEMLMEMGFADPTKVKPVVAAWASLIDRFRPNLVISDSAPSLIAAARGKVETLSIGNGWAIPPAGLSVPPLPFSKHDPMASRRAESRICGSFNEILGSSLALSNLGEILRGDRSVVCTPAVLDPYRLNRVEPTFWPPELPVVRNCRSVTSQQIVRIYLPPDHPAISSLDQALDELGLRAEGYFHGVKPTGLKKINISPAPFDFSSVLKTTACIVHQGGTGVAAYAMAYGTPQLVMPVDLEKIIAARAMEAEHMALAIGPASNALQLVKAIGKLVANSSLKPLLTNKTANADRTMSEIRTKCGITDEVGESSFGDKMRVR